MKEREIEIIKLMCQFNLNSSKVAQNMFLHRNSVEYHIKQIKKKYQLDPHNYYDLIKLEQIADGKVSAEMGDKEIFCKYCGKKITEKNRKTFCSDNCKTKFAMQRSYPKKKKCIECEYSEKEEGTNRYLCKKTGKIVISVTGAINKNASVCQ